jgi:hypothetical protein
VDDLVAMLHDHRFQRAQPAFADGPGGQRIARLHFAQALEFAGQVECVWLVHAGL